jgi:hypothetical protein
MISVPKNLCLWRCSTRLCIWWLFQTSKYDNFIIVKKFFAPYQSRGQLFFYRKMLDITTSLQTKTILWSSLLFYELWYLFSYSRRHIFFLFPMCYSSHIPHMHNISHDTTFKIILKALIIWEWPFHFPCLFQKNSNSSIIMSNFKFELSFLTLSVRIIIFFL